MSDTLLGQVWRADAPSNIALIKYMGKSSLGLNEATNPSLSYTLAHLRTHVELEWTGADRPSWEPLAGFQPVPLSERGQARFLAHLTSICQRFDCAPGFIVRSANDFPSDCGLATSASSFAALTLAAATALVELSGRAMPATETLADWSRQGSGSSCRSFFAPWCIWDGDLVARFECGYPRLRHQAIVVDAAGKEVSSSEAHRRVSTSLLNAGRSERARWRMAQLTRALNEKQWHVAYAITWNEFWDMHALFETAAEPFGYMSEKSLAVLEAVRDLWRRHGDGPLLTMDAGANVHLLYRPDQNETRRLLAEQLSRDFMVVTDAD